MIKPGYRTSEFWFTLVSFIFSGFILILHYLFLTIHHHALF